MAIEQGVSRQAAIGRAYQTVQITTSSAPRIVLMLYENGLRFAAQAKQQVLAGNKREAYKARGKLLSILSGLLSSLVLETGHEEVKSFLFLYEHMSEAVRETDIEEQDYTGFDEVVRIMGELRDAWRTMLVENNL